MRTVKPTKEELRIFHETEREYRQGKVKTLEQIEWEIASAQHQTIEER